MHPVLMELETLYLMTYLPALAPVIGEMARDFYGIDYADPAHLARFLTRGRVEIIKDPLRRAWQSRTSNEWLGLSKKYHFRLVLSPTRVPLDLTPALRGPVWTLYTIP